MSVSELRTCWIGLAVLTGAACSSNPGNPSVKPDGGDQGAEGGACYPNGTCNAGLSCANDVCVAVAADAGNEASDGLACSYPNQVCDSTCEDNCVGSVDPDCSAGCCQTTQAQGVICKGACMSAKTLDCAGSCVDSQTDAQNCSQCGKACGSNESCTGGKCTVNAMPDAGGQHQVGGSLDAGDSGGPAPERDGGGAVPEGGGGGGAVPEGGNAPMETPSD